MRVLRIRTQRQLDRFRGVKLSVGHPPIRQPTG
jgi:hypothetical protein